jgi:hypothetical protein
MDDNCSQGMPYAEHPGGRCFIDPLCRCATCKYWEEIWPEPNAPGMCALTVVEGDSIVELEPTHNHTLAEAFAFFPDYTDFYRMGLLTRPEFGCVQWEKAETPAQT